MRCHFERHWGVPVKLHPVCADKHVVNLLLLVRRLIQLRPGTTRCWQETHDRLDRQGRETLAARAAAELGARIGQADTRSSARSTRITFPAHVYLVQFRGQLWFSPLLMSLFYLCRDNSYHIYSFGPPKLCFPFSWTCLIKHGRGRGRPATSELQSYHTSRCHPARVHFFFLLLRSFYVLQHNLLFQLKRNKHVFLKSGIYWLNNCFLICGGQRPNAAN